MINKMSKNIIKTLARILGITNVVTYSFLYSNFNNYNEAINLKRLFTVCIPDTKITETNTAKYSILNGSINVPIMPNIISIRNITKNIILTFLLEKASILSSQM